MRRILICTGILGGGTALTFAAAAVAASLLPGGTVVSANPMMFRGGGWEKGPVVDLPVPEPVPPDIEGGRDGVWVADPGVVVVEK